MNLAPASHLLPFRAFDVETMFLVKRSSDFLAYSLKFSLQTIFKHKNTHNIIMNKLEFVDRVCEVENHNLCVLQSNLRHETLFHTFNSHLLLRLSKIKINNKQLNLN